MSSGSTTHGSIVISLFVGIPGPVCTGGGFVGEGALARGPAGISSQIGMMGGTGGLCARSLARYSSLARRGGSREQRDFATAT